MERLFSHAPREDATTARAARFGAGPLVLLLLAGLLADVAPNDGAHAGLDYALSLLALLGAAGCVVSLTHRLSSGLGPLPWARSAAPGLPAPAALSNVSGGGEDWPLLVALLLGTLVVLLAGFGGWV